MIELALALGLHHGRAQIKPAIYNVASPAAGSEWSTAVPAGVVWLPLSVRFRLVTSATVANRTPALTYTDATNTFSSVGTSIAQTATSTWNWSYMKNLGINLTASGSALAFPLPSLPLPGGFVISTVTGSLQVGDQYSLIVLYVLEFWPESYGEARQRLGHELLGQPGNFWHTLLKGV